MNPKSDATADVTVIGAGFAGLTAAALLARNGLRVNVLERDIHPGGCATAYQRKTSVGTFRFAVGATVAAGLEPGGLLADIYARLGLRTNARALDPVMRLHLRGASGHEQHVQIPGTRAAWDAQLTEHFPQNLERKRRFWKDVQGLADTMHHAARKYPVMPWRSLHDVLDTAAGIHPGVFKVLGNLHRTVADLLEHHQVDDPAHRALIDGQLLDSMQCSAQDCALPNGAYALEVYRYGAQYVPGGLASIAEDLAGSVLANGGHMHYATRARRILIEQGRAVGVETHGRTFRSPVVISTAPLPDTVNLLGDSSPLSLQQRSQALPEIWGAFTLYLGVSEAALPKDVHSFEQVVDYNEHGLLENFLVSISPAWDRARAPEGFRSITISTHVHAALWQDLDSDAYHAKKRELAGRILNRLEALWPGFQSSIVHLESGSPRTFERFTLHSLGRVGGVPQTPQHANFNAQHHASGVPGLLLAGETIFPGQGTIGVAVSGFNAYRTSTRYLRRTRPATNRTPLEPAAQHSRAAQIKP